LDARGRVGGSLGEKGSDGKDRRGNTKKGTPSVKGTVTTELKLN